MYKFVLLKSTHSLEKHEIFNYDVKEEIQKHYPIL